MAVINKKEINPEAIALENIFLALEGLTFCKDVSAYIVGGSKKLESLISEGKIEVEKRTNSKNGKWFCNAAQVMKHCRNMRKIK